MISEYGHELFGFNTPSVYSSQQIFTRFKKNIISYTVDLLDSRCIILLNDKFNRGKLCTINIKKYLKKLMEKNMRTTTNKNIFIKLYVGTKKLKKC